MREVVEKEGTAILLVDDDAALLAVLGRALSAPGVAVTGASSAEAALLKLAAGFFDVVVSDINMPGMNGLKLLHAVRQHDLDLPVVLMTADPDLKSAAAAVEYGAFQYLIKPIVIDRLRAVVDRAINVGRMARLKRACAEEFGSGSFYVGDRAGIDSKLNLAFQSLWMAYQPIVRAADSETFGYEALMRSDEPALPNPNAVLIAAEKVGRLHDVGRAVRALVAAQAAEVAREGALVFVNMHSEDLLDPALYLPSAGLSRVAGQVILELNDRASLERVNDVPARLEKLRALGFRIAIDDLGGGQADPATFARLEPEFVKLDIRMIRGIDRDSAKQKIVGSITRLCRNMGRATVAEGVENELERATLIEAGCDFLQGYLFGHPRPLSALERPNERLS